MDETFIRRRFAMMASVPRLMLTQDRWLLPEGIEEIFPDEAEGLDRLGRGLIDRFASWGYRLVMPPMIDFLDSLRVGTGHELDLQTFKLTDPVSGRLIGLRADMTPQVARIDARSAASGLPSRLCYVGSVLHALPGHLEKSRNPLQVGAELYGHAGESAAIEVIRLMLETLDFAGVSEPHLDLGHVSIYRELAGQAGLLSTQEADLFNILQRKDASDLEEFLADAGVTGTVKRMLSALLDLNGPSGVVEAARSSLAAGGPVIAAALDELDAIAGRLQARFPGLPLNIDLAELRGYHYHTGVVFAALAPGQGREIARGGRYDDIGRVFGHARPAVGFSADLKMLARLSESEGQTTSVNRIFAPAIDDPELERTIQRLRRQGQVVIQSLGSPGESAQALGCSQTLRKCAAHWQIG